MKKYIYLLISNISLFIVFPLIRLTSKSFYEKKILPYVLNFTCNSRPIDYQRKKVIPDFRPHNNIRLGFAPLYVGFFDLFETVMILKSILENKEYLSVDQSKKTVT